MALLYQNTPFNKTFLLISSSDHLSPLLGAQPTVLISKNGQPFTTPQGPVSELGNGWYVVAYTANDTNTFGDLDLHVTAPGADETDLVDQIYPNINLNNIPGINPLDFSQFIMWIQTIMGVGTDILPINSPYIVTAYVISSNTVNQDINMVNPALYNQAVYNLGGDILVNITQDSPPSTYWTDLRKSMQVNNFVPGVVRSANDEDSNAGILVPKAFDNLTISDLQNLKTPWGRTYLAIAQSAGTMWGLS